jgi:hypothetical protein
MRTMAELQWKECRDSCNILATLVSAMRSKLKVTKL